MAVQAADTAVQRGAHAVQFYDHDDELVAAVGRYLVQELSAGAFAIVIATESHRQSFENEIAARGLDPEPLQRDRQLLMLDAADTLARFMCGGRVDRDGFERVIGSLVREALATGRPVVAFGEMVALLWDAGDVPGAIELEKLWNELRDEVPFSLLCGYQSASVSGPGQTEALEHVCHLHSAVIGTPARAAAQVQVSARFAPRPDAPAEARRMVAEAVREWGHSPELVADTQLVVSELATNAVKHARTPFSVTIRREHSGLHIAVADRSRARPVLREAGPEALFGRGMRLVAEVAERWGIDPAGEGKIIWAHVRS